MKRFGYYVVLCLTVALLISGCAGPQAPTASPKPPEPTATPKPPEPTATPKPPEPKEIVVVVPADIKSLDKWAEETFNSMNITGNIFDRLLQFDKDMNIQPMLATSYEVLDDHTWRFHLRRGVTFHNGEPFNAQAVKFTFDRASDPESVLAYYVRNVEETKVIDDYTVDVITTVPDATLHRKVGIWIDIASPGAVEELGDRFRDHPVGTGPFKFVEWAKGDHVTVEANKDYWGGAPGVDRVVFKFVTEPSTRMAMLKAGEADLISNVSADQISELIAAPGVKIQKVLGFRKMLVILPASGPTLDIRVRKALNYAVDKQLIVDTILQGYAEVAAGAVHIKIPGHNPDVKPYPYDPNEAKRLLAEAGYPEGFEMDLYHTVGTFPKDKETAEAIAGQLSAIGLKVKPVSMEWGAFKETVVSVPPGEAPGMAYMRYGNALGDPSELYTWALWSEGNWMEITDPTLDEMIGKTEVTLDQDARIEMFKEMEKYTRDELVPWIFLFDLENVFGLSQRLEWVPSPYEPIDLRGVSVTQ